MHRIYLPTLSGVQSCPGRWKGCVVTLQHRKPKSARQMQHNSRAMSSRNIHFHSSTSKKKHCRSKTNDDRDFDREPKPTQWQDLDISLSPAAYSKVIQPRYSRYLPTPTIRIATIEQAEHEDTNALHLTEATMIHTTGQGVSWAIGTDAESALLHLTSHLTVIIQPHLPTTSTSITRTSTLA